MIGEWAGGMTGAHSTADCYLSKSEDHQPLEKLINLTTEDTFFYN